MFKQVKYEFLKIFKNRLLVLFLAGFFVLNMPMFSLQTTAKNSHIIDTADEYQQQEAYYKSIPFDEAYTQLEEKSMRAEKLQLIEIAQENNDTAMLDGIIADDPDILTEYSRMLKEKSLPTNNERAAIRHLYDQAVHIAGYQEYIEGMQSQADGMKEFSIFNKLNSFSVRNIDKTPIDFENNNGLPLSFGQSEGLIAFSNFFTTDVFVLFLILIVCVRLFWDEREKGLLVLVKSTAYGRMSTAVAKLITLALASAAIALAFYGTNILVSVQLLGVGDTSRYIQSMKEFAGCNLPITVSQYIMAFLVGKIVIVLVFALMFSALFSYFNNSAIATLVIFCVTGTSFLAYRFIPPLSPINSIKYLNPVAGIDIMNVISQYNNINAFGFPGNRIVMLAVVMTLLMALSCLGIIHLHNAKKGDRNSFYLLEKIRNGIQLILAKLNGVNLFWHELRKLLFSRKMVILPVALALIIANSIMKQPPVHQFDENVYLDYIAVLEGDFTPQKEAYFLEEQARFNNASAKASELSEQLNSGTITKREYDYGMFLLESFQKKQTGFLMVEKQYNYVKQLQSTGIRVGFVNEISADYAFNQSSRDAFLALILLALIVCITAVMFCHEYEHGMINIINPTKRGKAPLYATKAVVISILAICFMAIFIPEYVNQALFYSIDDLSLPIKNISIFKNINSNISIMGFMVLSRLVQAITGIATVFVVIMVSTKLKNQVVTIILSSTLLLIPIIIYLCGVEWGKYLPFASAYLLNQSMRSDVGCVASVISIFVSLAGGIILARMSYLEFCNERGLFHATGNK